MAVDSNGVVSPAADEVLLVTSGDLRLAANQVCWPAQRDMEEKLTAAFAKQGIKLVRAHAYDETLKHGFISSQRRGMDVFMSIHPDAPLHFATAAWQYSHHVLPGLRSHKGPGPIDPIASAGLPWAPATAEWPNTRPSNKAVEIAYLWNRGFLRIVSSSICEAFNSCTQG